MIPQLLQGRELLRIPTPPLFKNAAHMDFQRHHITGAGELIAKGAEPHIAGSVIAGNSETSDLVVRKFTHCDSLYFVLEGAVHSAAAGAHKNAEIRHHVERTSHAAIKAALVASNLAEFPQRLFVPLRLALPNVHFCF